MSEKRPKYAVYKTNKIGIKANDTAEEATAYHVRLSPRSTISTEEIAKDLALEKHFNIETTHSFLSILSQYIERKNSEGHIVKIEGLGSFMPSIHPMEPIVDPETMKNTQVKITDLTFITDRGLQRRLKTVDLIRDWEKGNCTLDADDRRTRILEYFDSQAEISGGIEYYMTRKKVMELNKCSRQTASKDLAALIKQGLIRQVGSGSAILYRRV